MRLFKSFFIFLILTLVTQVGGFIYLIYEMVHPMATKNMKSMMPRVFVKVLIYGFLYLLICIPILPIIASAFGRVPLPFLMEKNEHVKPASIFYPLANRHYVTPELKEEFLKISEEYCGKTDVEYLTYLDANFPFLDGYPMHPHKSHHDGKKLDISFIFRDKSKKVLSKSPSILGYGFVEGPKKGEVDKPKECGEDNKYYNFMSKITSQNKAVTFDQKLNTSLLRALSSSKVVDKIFIEPHLKNRLGLKRDKKIRFHGCNSVRHDDHIHLQLAVGAAK